MVLYNTPSSELEDRLKRHINETTDQYPYCAGCKVIAFAGTPAKVDYVKSLGADHVYNYKTEDVGSVLKTVAPEGINCYFDNVSTNNNICGQRLFLFKE